MKKRLLALCLAAAMLLGMMPALTLSTNAVDDGNVQDKLITNEHSDSFNLYQGSLSSGNLTTNPDGAGYYFYPAMGANDANNREAWGRYNKDGTLEIDHSMDVTFQIELQGNQWTDIGEGKKLYTDENGTPLYGGNVWYFVLNDSDAENGGFVYYFLYVQNGKVWLQFLMPTTTYGADVYSDPIDLGLGNYYDANKGFSNRVRLKVVWSANGSVEVYSSYGKIDTSLATLFNFADYALVGTVKNATWTRNTNAEKGRIDNPKTIGTIDGKTPIDGGAADFFEMCLAHAAGTAASGYVWDAKLTHNTYVLPQVEGIFTDEALTAEGALNESSWEKASFEDLGNGLEAAVLMNKGVAYVAVKGIDGTYNVQLGTTTKSVTVADGEGEVAFDDVALTNYGETRELTVGTAKAVVTFAAKKVNPVDTVTTKVDTHTNITNAYCNVSNSAYVAFAKQAIQYIEKSGSHGDVVIDRSGDVTIDLQMTFQENAFAAGMTTLSAGDNNAYSSDVKNYLLFAPYDSATKTHFLAYFTADAEYDLYLRFYLKDKTTANVDLGKNIKDTDGSITQIDLKTLQLVWNTDGSVTVKLNGEELQTVQNATWDTKTSHLGYLDNPGSSAMNVNYDYYHIRGQRESGNNAYLWGLYFTNAAPATVDITTSVADDLVAKVETALGDLSDVSFLPKAVEHDALGTVALTWSDTANLVNNNILTIPSEDTKTILTAKAGETTVWSGEVTVKAADPIVGVFTPEDLESGVESWSLVPFTNLNNSTDSVAVLATDINNVYVAVKSADSSATVILNGSEQTVSIADGMGVVKFENVGLSAYGDARTIKVTTSTGSLDTKVLFNATEVKLPSVNTNKVDMHNDGVYAYIDKTNPAYIQFAAANQIRYTEKSGSYGDVVIDRSKDVTIDLQMTFQENAFTNSMDTLSAGDNNAFTWSATNYLLFAPYDSATKTHFLAYFTADAEYDLYLRFFLNDKTTADVDLGANIKENGDGKITAIDLKTLQLVWNTDGSVTVKLNGEELQTVANATWNTVTSKSGGYIDRPSAMDVNYDAYRVITKRTSGNNAYIWGLSFNTPEEGKVQDIVKANVEKQSVTLASDVAMNFLLNDVAGATLKVVHNGETYTYYTDKLSANDAGYLNARLNLAAAQMADDIAVTLVDAYGMTTCTGTTSVEDYAADALKLATDDNVKNMINAMLNYGAAAKAYFKYKLDNAMGAVTAPSLGNLTDLDAAAYDHSVSGELEGISATSATLRLEEQVKIRFYFNGDITAYEVTGGEAVYDDVSGRSYVDVAVAPKNIDQMQTVSVSDGTNTLSVTYGCYTYLTRHAGHAELGDLMQAMYIYSLAAEAYPA